jgi:hypothetical protein
MERIAADTEGQYLHSESIGELLSVLGNLDEEITDDQLVASANVPPGEPFVLAMANHSMTITISSSEGFISIINTYLIAPDGSTYSAAGLISDPSQLPGVNVSTDPTSDNQVNENRFISIELDGGAVSQGEWRISVTDTSTAIIVREDSPSEERYDLAVSSAIEQEAIFPDSDPFDLNITWCVAGASNNPESVTAALSGPIGEVQLQEEYVSIGRYVVNIDPSVLGLVPGMYRIDVSAWANSAGEHRRQWTYSFNVYERLEANLPPLPLVIVAEEPFSYQIEVPGGYEDVNAEMEILDGRSVHRFPLPFRGIQGSNAIYGGVIELGTANATEEGRIRVEARRDNKIAFRFGYVRILPGRGLWVRLQQRYVSVDLKGDIQGELPITSVPATVDGGNGSLWVLGLADGQKLTLNSYDRIGRYRLTSTIEGIRAHNLAAYKDHLAVMADVRESGRIVTRLFMYHPDRGVYARHLGANGPLLMIDEGECYFGQRDPAFGTNRVKVMYIKDDNEPVQMLPALDLARLRVIQMPDGQVAWWMGYGQAIRSFDSGYPNLTERLNGQEVQTDAFGFWLFTGRLGSISVPPSQGRLFRYEPQPDNPNQYEKQEIQLPGFHSYLDEMASSRKAGAVFLACPRSTDNLGIASEKGLSIHRLEGRIMKIHPIGSNEGPYP